MRIWPRASPTVVKCGKYASWTSSKLFEGSWSSKTKIVDDDDDANKDVGETDDLMPVVLVKSEHGVVGLLVKYSVADSGVVLWK